MARKISIAAIISLMFISIGCQDNYTNGDQPLPPRTSPTTYYPSEELISADAGETYIIEMVVKKRMEYKQSLEALKYFYNNAGNNDKFHNASDELNALNTMPQYEYLDVLDIQGFDPIQQIPDADFLYESAMRDKKDAEKYGLVFANKNLYRSALNKFKDLLRNYRKSDKVDDVAFEAGEIYESLKNYSTAFDYYEKVYTWNADNPYPARLKAARILDRFMHNYSEALPLYEKGIEIEGRYNKNFELVKNAKERVAALKKTVEP